MDIKLGDHVRMRQDDASGANSVMRHLAGKRGVVEGFYRYPEEKTAVVVQLANNPKQSVHVPEQYLEILFETEQ